MRNEFQLACAIVLAASVAGCAIPVQAKRADPDQVYASICENVLLTGEPSVAAQFVLSRAGLARAWTDDPAAAVRQLHFMATLSDTRDRLFGLAELCSYEGRRAGDSHWYLGSAVYAYLYLFGEADAPPPGPFDPRFRVACDLYARGVAEAFRDAQSGEFVPRAGRFRLPVGEIDIAVPSTGVQISDVVYDEFRCSDDFEVKGVRTRVRVAGLGTSLIARRRNPPRVDDVDNRVGYLPQGSSQAMTALLTLDGELSDIQVGRMKATLAIKSPLLEHGFAVRGAEVPLAVDLTTPLAYSLGTSPLWDFEPGAFVSGGESKIKNGILYVAPYRRGKIPIVLVHGTASSPATWLDLLNELMADREISERYQVWLFIYSSGGPVLASASSLREVLTDTLKSLDPEGADAALRRIVMIGHSQGGVITRLMATASGDRFWKNVSDERFDAMSFDPSEEKTFRDQFFFEPLPQVERVVFLATPHRGSYLAGGFVGTLSDHFVALPRKLMDAAQRAIARNLVRLHGDKIVAVPTAVEDMTPGSPFNQALQSLPVDPRVRVNSIVAVEGDGPVEQGDDGVVTYESAHWPAAESELVVKTGHSCQGDPRTINEIRRILHEHLMAAPAAAPVPK
jgi:pimeloyl-ACP methyl ester carboxylesterase